MAKRKVGRPKNRVRTTPVTIRLRAPDYDKVRQLAEAARLTPNGWIVALVVRALDAVDTQAA